MDGVPDLRLDARNSTVGANSYAHIHGSFTPRTVSDEEAVRQAALLDITPELVEGKTVLLAGTGMGLQLLSITATTSATWPPNMPARRWRSLRVT